MARVIKEVRFAGLPETPVYDKPTKKPKQVNVSLFGTWMGVVEEGDAGWLKVVTAGPDGWVKVGDTRKEPVLKAFFLDVGQGDACLIEAGDKRILVDAGQYKNVKSYLNSWQYSYEKTRIHLDVVFISHFDADHYAGLMHILKEKKFTIGKLYHNGIAKFAKKKAERPNGYDQTIGATDPVTQDLVTSFSTIDDARAMLQAGGLQATFRRFLTAVVKAYDEKRIGEMRRLTSLDRNVPGFDQPGELMIEILGPVPLRKGGGMQFRWFSDAGKTLNGNSLVLKFQYNGKTMLMGGDLNREAEEYLMDHYQNRPGTFSADVVKCCHHGSSDFSGAWVKQNSPYVTVISSGDNESYSHPRADALGAAGKYGRGDPPLIFSTELARSYIPAKKVLYGMINVRTDGGQLVVGQLKEKRTGVDVWDSYVR